MRFLGEKWKLDRCKYCTQEELAGRTGLRLEIVRNIESGRKKVNTEHPEFMAMCKALELNPVDYFVRDTKVITFLSNKGGSTKTTSCANLAYVLATKFDKKILLIDTDLQQNLTQHYGIMPQRERNFYTAFVKDHMNVQRHIRPTGYDNIDIITGHDNLSIIESDLANMAFKEFRMKEMLEPLLEIGEYDFIMVDCNPSLNSLNTSILFATHGLVVPLIPTAFGRSGLELIVSFYKSISHRAEHLQLLGVLVNRYDQRKRVPRDVIQLVTEQFGESSTLFKTYIPEDASVDKAQLMGEPLAISFKDSRATVAFESFAEEFLKRSRIL